MCLKSPCFPRVLSSEHLWENVLDARILSKEESVSLFLVSLPKPSPCLPFCFHPLLPQESGSRREEGALLCLGQWVIAVHSVHRLQPHISSRHQHVPAALSKIREPDFTMLLIPGSPIGLFQKALCPRWRCLRCVQHSVWS